MIGANTLILPNVRIGSNVIIGAGSIVSKDIPDNSVAVGVPCKVVGDFNSFKERRRCVKKISNEQIWKDFIQEHGRNMYSESIND